MPPSKNIDKFLYFLILIISVLSLIYFMVSGRPVGYVIRNDIQPQMILADERLIIGDNNASWTIVEFGDYECPPCAEAYKTISKLSTNKNIRLLFKHFPLDIHEHAHLLANIAEYENSKGKFEAIHNEFYSNISERMSKIHFYEKRTKLLDKFSVNVQRDIDLAKKIKIKGTPSIFLVNKTGSVYEIKDMNEIERIVK